MTLQRPWGPRKAFAFWGEEEQRSERAFRVYTETIDTEFVTTRARQRCGEIPGQELFRVKRQKEAFDMQLIEITLPKKQNAIQTKKSSKINPKSYSKKECDSYSENDQK